MMRTLTILLLLVFGAFAHAPAAEVTPVTPSASLDGDVGYLGVALGDIDADRASVLKLGDERGVEVIQVEDGSPADKSGIRNGDVLLTYNGETILSVQQLGRLVRETPPGRKVKVQYWRNGKTGTLSVVAGSVKRSDSAIAAQLAHIQTPGVFRYPGADIPNPLLLWKSSLLGVECEAVDSQLAEYFGVRQGVLIRFVLDDSPAKRAGLKAGDVLTTVGGRPVATPRDVTAALRMDRHGEKTIPVLIVRNHKPVTLNVVPPEY
jgi:serine protease Do